LGAGPRPEEGERDVEAPDDPPTDEMLPAPLRERGDDGIWQLESEEEPELPIPLDRSCSTRAGRCQVCDRSLRTRCRAAAAARPRTISRSPGRSIRRPFSPSGPAA